MEFMTRSLVKWDPDLTCWIPYLENKISTSKLTFDTSVSYIIRFPESQLRYIHQSWSLNRSVEIFTRSFDELKYFASRYYFRPDCKTSDHTCNNVKNSLGNQSQIKTLGMRKFHTLSIHFDHFDNNFYNLIVSSWKIAIWNTSVPKFNQICRLKWIQVEFRSNYKF